MIRKGTYSFSLWCVMAVLITATAGAQQQKIGYVDTDYILSEMPEYEGVQQQLRSISAEWNAELEKMKSEIANLKEDFQAKQILYSDQQKEKRQRKIQNKINQRQKFLDEKFGTEGEYFNRQQKLLEPIQRKVFNAVNVVARRGDFDFVFDRAQNSNMLYSVKEWNLNDEVLEELDVTLNDTSN